MPGGATKEVIGIGCGMDMAIRVLAGSARHDAPLVLHLHGGAFQPHTLDCACTVAALLARAGAVVISADYPAGRAHPFPEALEAAFSLLLHVHKHRARWAGKASKLFVAGEEAGGNLAAGLAMMARDRRTPPLAGQILLSPMLDAGMATCSMRSANAGPVGCKWADGWHDYLGSPEKAAHPYAMPAAATRLAGLAPALVLTAEDDPMRDESSRYAARLRDSAVLVQSHVLPAPTRWPDALGIPTPAGAEWADAVQAALSAFFALTTRAAAPDRAASPHMSSSRSLS